MTNEERPDLQELVNAIQVAALLATTLARFANDLEAVMNRAVHALKAMQPKNGGVQ